MASASLANELAWLGRSLSGAGLILGTLFFAAALTPSLAPRTFQTQGVLCGVAFSCGYGIGFILRCLWLYLELPEPPGRLRKWAISVVGVLCLGLVGTALNLSVDWQNSIRLLMQLQPLTTAYSISVSLLALITFAVLLLLSRVLIVVGLALAAASRRILPRKLANIAGALLTLLLVWNIANGVLVDSVFSMVDRSYKEYDALIAPDTPQPSDTRKTGGPGSLIQWHEVGRAGREFISTAPSAAEISAFTGKPAHEPIRVYAGLNVGESTDERARRALDELLRLDGFDRDVLVIITPTGTGWVDPSAIDSLEYLHHGNVASVAVQYSYLASPFSLLFQPDYGEEAARALFLAVYNHWKTLPADERPALYLHGLSLGAMHSEKSLALFEMLADPIQGALWSGPTFNSEGWRQLTRDRNSGSPEWLPVFRDGSFVRFMNQHGQAPGNGQHWGPMRVMYLQYASDAVTFFDQRALYRQPDWMREPRGPDVSSALTWYPVVTMLQLALDLGLTMVTPMGYGHVYAPEHYLQAWAQVAPAPGWSEQALENLKQHLRQRIDARQESNQLRGG